MSKDKIIFVEFDDLGGKKALVEYEDDIIFLVGPNIVDANGEPDAKIISRKALLKMADRLRKSEGEE